MLVFGKISKINIDADEVKLKLEEYDTETVWLKIPHLWTINNKSNRTLEVKALAAAILNEDMTEGILLGVLYNDKDRILVEYKGKDYVRFSDGVMVLHEPDSKKLKIIGDVEVDGNITSTKDISDKNGTVQNIRDWANAHVHSNGNEGANTGAPTSNI